MSHWPRKRRHQGRDQHSYAANSTPFVDQSEKYGGPDPALFIQAHEADIIRGPQAVMAARSLEVDYIGEGANREVHIGDGLIRWTGQGELHEAMDNGEETLHLGVEEALTSTGHAKAHDTDAIWVDRYDARLLLDTLPSTSLAKHIPEPSSPSGWSDLPSDTEDTFFFSVEEAEDYHREKRRRTIASDRATRLEALRLERGEEEEEQEEQWGGSDEEPDDAQKQLMQRTATHILSSPNPAQLEMRILANHGADRRFAFLKGRWSRAWKIAKGRVRTDMAKEKAQANVVGSALGGLAGYGGSDDDSSSDNSDYTSLKEQEMISAKTVAKQDGTSSTPNAEADAEEVIQARRARAKEWAERRRAAAALGHDSHA